MREPWEWTEEDLLSLIANGVQEDVSLDYKRSDALQKTEACKSELSKDVSAFANSTGGTLVYGVEEDGHVPISFDQGLDPDVITKEWLDQVIASRIQRRIEGVRINQIKLTQNVPGRVAYVVYVPQSFRAPHQAADKKFYKRYNFQSAPMEEYEIRDVAHRSDSPVLRLRYSFQDSNEKALHPVGSCSNADEVALYVDVWNESPTPAEHFVAHLFLDENLNLAPIGRLGEFSRKRKDHVQFGQIGFRANHLVRHWSTKDHLPVFEGEVFRLSEYHLSITLRPRTGEFHLGWQVRAPRMTPQSGYAMLKSDGTTARIENHDTMIGAQFDA